MSYIALYREWRPKVFNDIIGQEHITRTLKNQIKQDRIAHAYLFCGTRGTGKTTTAKVFAKAVNCLNPVDFEPCGKCEACISIDKGNATDVYEIDAASNNGVDNIRELREDVKYTPSKCKYKVYIIDEVHMLSSSAFNALLKTLEEPPPHVIFILATTEFQKVPATILSRCQRFDFKRIKPDAIVNRLKFIAHDGNIKVEDKTLKLIARNSDGALRDALSIFDQCISLSADDVRYEDVLEILGISTDEYLMKVADAVTAGDTAKCIFLIDELIINGKDVYQFIKDLTMHFRNLLICNVGEDISAIINVSDEILQEFKIQSKKFSTESILRNINILSDAQADAKWYPQPRIILEMAVIRMCKKELGTDSDSILERLSKIESTISHPSLDVPVQSTAVPMQEVLFKKNIKDENPKSEVKDIVKKEMVSSTSFTEISKKWKDIMKAINGAGYKKLNAFLLEGKPMELVDGILNIGFEKNYKFHKDRVDEPDNKRLIEEFISSICSFKVKVKCTMIDEIAVDRQEDDIVEKTISIFGKDLVEVEE